MERSFGLWKDHEILNNGVNILRKLSFLENIFIKRFK